MRLFIHVLHNNHCFPTLVACLEDPALFRRPPQQGVLCDMSKFASLIFKFAKRKRIFVTVPPFVPKEHIYVILCLCDTMC